MRATSRATDQYRARVWVPRRLAEKIFSVAKAIRLIFLLFFYFSSFSSAIWGFRRERKPDISAVLVHVSKLSNFFREVPCDFNNSEESAAFSNTCANYCVLQDACDDLSSDIRMYVNVVISKFVIRLMKY